MAQLFALAGGKQQSAVKKVKKKRKTKRKQSDNSPKITTYSVNNTKQKAKKQRGDGGKKENWRIVREVGCRVCRRTRGVGVESEERNKGREDASKVIRRWVVGRGRWLLSNTATACIGCWWLLQGCAL